MASDPHPSPTTTATTAATATAVTTNTRPFPIPNTNTNTNTNPPSQSTRPNMSPLLYPQAHHHQHHYTPIRPTPSHHQQQSSHSQGVLYPVASSGRGFIPKPLPPMHAVTVAAHPGNATSTAAAAGGAYPPRPLVSYSQPHGLSHPVHVMRPPHYHHVHPAQLAGQGLGPGPGPVKGIPVSSPQSKGVPPSSVADTNGYRDKRDRSRDDTLTTIRDRKVRIIDGASLYALCRSWLRNGFPEESQPQYGDAVKALPKPLPIPVSATHLPKNKEAEEEEAEDKEDEESVEHLSPQDLLKGHIKHAKKVRARLREERLRRIARYKSRLALLLPPLVEQFRNDTAPRN
ncbi:RNA-binding motif protein 25-like [Corylus avellana]|uniref:RNA-binding motif protein 25-like n=1 Tax=Corylus avellana TaxID=13451 RepID=UPI00286AA550|nr:RNA-binding motif protein 25-like [Corylus avellana]